MLLNLVSRASTFLKTPTLSRLCSQVPYEKYSKMAENTEASVSKRPAPDSEDVEAKKLKVETEGQEGVKGEGDVNKVTLRKKKVALFLMYSGVGYYGMQIQQGSSPLPTIEGDLLDVLVKVGAIPQEHANSPQKMAFQRAARTDKGVSAAANCVSLKLLHNIPDLKDKINAALPEQIKVIDFMRTTATFDCKNYCDARTYSYLLPTFAFTPIEEVVYQSFRASEDTMKRVNEILAMYKGTHNFHNFTSGKKPTEMSANRYIIDMKCSDPFIQDDIEFALITVKGQSFMLHQIRKMIGLMIAIVRGLASVDCIQKSFGPFKTDVPKAPGLGLMLERLHYDTYNRRYGSDGIHVPLSYENRADDMEEFKKKHIYTTMVKTEKEDKSMMAWLSTLFSHNFDYRLNKDVPPRAEVGIGRAAYQVEKGGKESSEEKDKACEHSMGTTNGKDSNEMDTKNDSDCKSGIVDSEQIDVPSSKSQSAEMESKANSETVASSCVAGGDAINVESGGEKS